MTNSVLERYSKWLVSYPKLVLVLSLFFILATGSALPNLSFTNDYRVFFSEQNPELKAFEAMQRTYSKTDNVLFVIEPKAKTVFNPTTIDLVKTLTAASWQIPYSTRVDSVTNFQHTVAQDDDLLVGDLVAESVPLTPSFLDKVHHIATAEPLLKDRLVSPEANVIGVNVTIQLPGISLNEVPEVAAFARQLVAEMEVKYPDHTIYLTGLAMMSHAFSELSQQDMVNLVPIMLIMIVAMMGVLFRSLSAILISVSMIVATITFAMGVMAWLDWRLTPVSISAPTIILTMAVANTVHLLVTFLQQIRSGRNRDTATIESIKVNFHPIAITSITTAVGFLSMNFSDVPPFHDLGNIVAIGVIAAFILAITLLPAMAMLLGFKRQTHSFNELLGVSRVAGMVIRYQRLLLWILGTLAVLVITQIPKNQLDDQFVNYFDDTVDFRTATDFTSQHLTGIYTLQYSFDQGSSGGVSDPVFLNNIERFSLWLKQQPEVMHVQAISDIFKRLNQNMHGDDSDYYRLPASRELAAQYLLLYELSLPYGLDLNDQIDVDKAQTRITITLNNLATSEMLALEQRIADWIADQLPDQAYFSGSPSLMFAHIGERNISSMLFGTIVALILISLILVIALKSVKIGLLSLVPNLIPAGVAFGLWGLSVGQIGISLSIVAGMTLGIVVDDTVHFLSKYLRARRERGLNSEQAVRYAFETVGIALVVTSLVLVLGFLVLSQSHFSLNADMGMMAAITILVALIMDFLLLPPLLMKLEKS